MPDRVRFGTWNVYHGTHTDQLTPVLERLLAEHGEQLVLAMQEAGGRDITRWLKAHGMATFVHTDCRLAWLPGKWVRADARGARLSPTAYYRPGSTDPVFSEAANVMLCDRQGRSLDAWSAHLPPSVQHADPPANRLQANAESLQQLAADADDSQALGWAAGLDDNYDPDTGPQQPRLEADLGLRELLTGEPTFGHKREIDTVRIKRGGGLRSTGRAWTYAGHGAEHPAHRVRVHELAWRHGWR